MLGRWFRLVGCGVLFGVACLVCVPVVRAVEPVPAGFLWGVSGSAFQSEGGRFDSDWQRWIDEGRNGVHPYLDSVDFRHRYRSDIALAKRMGLNAFRFGVSWARVEPRPGVFDRRELAYYDDVVRTIRADGMTPIPTLQHFVYPGWVADQGGWKNQKTVDDFVRYATVIATRWRSLARYWLIFNEPTCDVEQQLSFGAISAFDGPAVADHFLQAHDRVYDVIHGLVPHAMVSSNECTSNFPTPTSLTLEQFVLERAYAAHKIDFVGIDVYYQADSPNSADFLLRQSTPWAVKQVPYGMYQQIRTYHERYPRVPVFVTENGIPTDNGKPRPDGLSRADHLRDNVYWMQRARDDGIPVIGYSYWSLTDNYEWGSYEPRFGLYTVNVTTDPSLTRRPTDAVTAYACIVSMHGVPAAYKPVRLTDGSPSGARNPLACITKPAPPTLTGLRLVPGAFRISSARHYATRIRFRIDQRAVVRFVVLSSGRPRRRLGSFTTTRRRGNGSVPWTGKLQGRALTPGVYLLTATPIANGVRGRSHTIQFVVHARSLRRKTHPADPGYDPPTRYP